MMTGRLRLLRDVRGDWPIGHETVAKARIYESFEILTNKHGAVSVWALDDEWLGIKPEEMEWLDEVPQGAYLDSGEPESASSEAKRTR